MGLFDFLFGKKPSDSLPSWATGIYNNPAPQFQQYLQTGMLPERTSTSGSSGTSTSSTKGNSFTRGSVQPFFKNSELPIANALRGRIMNRLSNGSSVPEGYQAMGLANIGRTSDAAIKGLEGNLASRGLESPMGSNQLYADRAMQQSDFLNSMPLLQRNLENEDLGLASGYLSSFGTGSESQSATNSNSLTNSSNTSSGFSTDPGGFDYGGYGGMLSSLMPYYTSGRQGGLLTPELLAAIAGMFIPGGGKK